MFQKKKWQINILENQLVLSYSVQPKGIITQTLILVDLLWVCCCCCFEFESSLLLARNTKIMGGLVGVGAGRKKRGKQLMMTLCLEELGRVSWNWCSHTVPHPMVLSQHVQHGWQLLCDRHLEEAVVCIGGRSPGSFQGGRKLGLYSLTSSFPMDLRILWTGYSLNIMDTAGGLKGAKVKWELWQFITLAFHFHLLSC